MGESRLRFKAYHTRHFRTDLHYRMRLLAARKGITIEEIFNLVVEKGLEVFERGKEARSSEEK